jgi:hypothetical protein
MDLKNLKQCWLSPTGEIFTGIVDNFCFHENQAIEILQAIFKLKEKYEVYDKIDLYKETASSKIEKLGWIRLHQNFYGHKWLITSKITVEQKKIINNWCIENNYNFENSIEKVFV